SFLFQAEDGIRDATVTGVQTCALPIWTDAAGRVGAHIGLSFSQASLEGRTGPAATASGRDIAGRRRTSQGPARGIICGWRTRMKIGRASCRERVENEEVGGTVKKRGDE